MNVSVIIAAYNAASTISETLESLRAQTFRDWEAIVVDDNSSDETASIAARFADCDDRILVVSREQRGGESAARNTGIGRARYDWLLFLDADDWVSPHHLEQITAALASNPGLDAVHCGWTRVASDGSVFDQMHASSESGEIFATLARYCTFAIHACVVRRSMVEAVGGFDTALRTCPDWDLWQRVARTGARFGSIPESLAFYRMRAGQASADGFQLLADGLRVIERGHSPDPRVHCPHPSYADGVALDQLPNAKLLFACWAAGLVIGGGRDARPLLDSVREDHDPFINAAQVARQIFQSALLPTCRTPSDWAYIWPGLQLNIREFLCALETQAMSPGLAIRSLRALEDLILERSAARMPITIGATHAVELEITRPIPDVFPPPASERLLCSVLLEGERLGAIVLPVCDGMVPRYVLADAIVAEFAWQILGRYFEQTVYKDLEIKSGKNGLSVWRGGLLLADGLNQSDEKFWQKAHDRIGWTVFLQEICSRPHWPTAKFYDPQAVEESAESRVAPDDFCEVEMSLPIPDIKVSGRRLSLVPTVGGAPLGVVSIPVEKRVAPAHKVRTALLAESGFELARTAVREGLLGEPLLAPLATIRERLAARNKGGNSIPEGFERVRLLPSSAAALDSAAAGGENSIMFGRRAQETIGTSASRRAMLPVAATPELIEAARVAGEVLVHSPQRGEQAAHAVYAPDLIPLPPGSSRPSARRGAASSETLGRLINRLWSPRSGGVGDRRNEGAPGAAETSKLPILMYHRVASDGAAGLSRYRVSPAAFEEQLRYLRDTGYYSVSAEDWRHAMKRQHPLPGRAVMLTFDDGYLDFMVFAWPLLRLYGFSALVFLVAEEIGGTNRWDRAYGEEVPLLGWKHIRRLQAEGVEFGSHSASHRPLNSLSPAEIVREGARSRAILGRGLGQPVKSFAYPHGAEDRISQHLIGACGYVFGFSCRPGLSGFHDPMLALPRVEVTGSDTLKEFALKIDASEALPRQRTALTTGVQ